MAIEVLVVKKNMYSGEDHQLFKQFQVLILKECHLLGQNEHQSKHLNTANLQRHSEFCYQLTPNVA